MKRLIYILPLMLLISTHVITAQIEVSASDVQRLIECHRLLREDDSNNKAKESYFNAFPNTFSDFQSVFGYEETPDSLHLGALYFESLDYITQFFQLNTDIRHDLYSDKIIRLCINGKWQADGVNFLQTNVVNIVTFDRSLGCFYKYPDIVSCYDESLKNALLSRLTQYEEKEILSFWQFYFDGIKSGLTDDRLFHRTKACIRTYPSLTELLDKIYFTQDVDGLSEEQWAFNYDGLFYTTIENGKIQSDSGSYKNKVAVVNGRSGDVNLPNYSGLDTCIIPSYVYWHGQQMQVVGIEEFAFEDCKNLKYIEIPTTIKYIDGMAFSGCDSLENILVPTSVDTIGLGAFRCCPSLKTVYIPKSTKVHEDAFRNECLEGRQYDTNAQIIRYKRKVRIRKLMK